MVPFRNWNEARLYCLNLTDNFASYHLSFDLPSIHSSEENDVIYSKLYFSVFPIGLKREAGKDEFTWTDGSPLDYTRWSDNCPRIDVRLTYE